MYASRGRIVAPPWAGPGTPLPASQWSAIPAKAA